MAIASIVAPPTFAQSPADVIDEIRQAELDEVGPLDATSATGLNTRTLERVVHAGRLLEHDALPGSKD